MTRLELARWRGQWENRGVLPRIRKIIQRRVAQGECVLVDAEDAVGLGVEDLRAMVQGIPVDKVIIAGNPHVRPFPLPLPSSMVFGGVKKPLKNC